jgi:hypothetical protein
MGVGFQFLACHAIKKLIEADRFTAVDPLTYGVDLAVRLDCADDSRCGDLNLPGLLDYPLQGCPNIALSLGEQSESMGVSVDGASIGQFVFLSNF